MVAARTKKPRTCVACRETVDRELLIRWFPCPDTGVPLPDWSGRSAGLGGRGGWTHAHPSCIAQALQGGLARAWRTAVPKSDPDALVAQACEAGERRWHARLGLALRAGALRVGQQALREAGVMQAAHLLIVADDAGEAGRQRVLRNAERIGVPVVLHPEGAVLGKAMGREFVTMTLVVGEPFRGDLLRLAAALASFPTGMGMRVVGESEDGTGEGGFCAPEELDAGAISAR